MADKWLPTLGAIRADRPGHRVGTGVSFRQLAIPLPIKGPALLAVIGALFLPSTFIGIATLPVLAMPLLFLAALMNRARITEFYSLVFTVVSVLLVILSSSLSGQPTVEMLKAAVGLFSFLFTLVALPILFERQSERVVAISEVLFWLIARAFTLEYFKIISFKEVGLVGWFQHANIGYFLGDSRPSGLLGEPSWFVLAAGVTAWIGVHSSRRGSIVLIAAVIVFIMSGSAIGAVFGSVLIADRVRRLVATGSQKVFLQHILTVFILFGVFGYFLSADVGSHTAMRIINPFLDASGYSRFVLPLPYLELVLREAPLFGFGLAWTTENLLGVSGLAIVPINVVLEMGIFGISIYGILISRVAIRARSDILSLVIVLIILFGIGLHVNAFNSTLLVFGLGRGLIARGE